MSAPGSRGKQAFLLLILPHLAEFPPDRRPFFLNGYISFIRRNVQSALHELFTSSRCYHLTPVFHHLAMLAKRKKNCCRLMFAVRRTEGKFNVVMKRCKSTEFSKIGHDFNGPAKFRLKWQKQQISYQIWSVNQPLSRNPENQASSQPTGNHPMQRRPKPKSRWQLDQATISSAPQLHIFHFQLLHCCKISSRRKLKKKKKIKNK